MHRDPRFEVDDLTRVVRVASGGPALDHIDIDDSTFLFSAHFKRSGADLILTGDGHKLILADYFTLAKRPDLTSHGATISADLVAQLAGPNAPGQYAQASAPAGAVVIGRCERLGGGARVQHANGVEEDLKVGDAILRGDVVMTSDGSSAVLSLTDGTVLNMGASARMVLSELIYDPNSSSNSAVVSLVKGTFSFIAGHVAHTGDMKLDTPVATMGIRGTAGTTTINADASGAVYEVNFSLMPDPDGHVGLIQVLDRVTGLVIGTISTTANVLNVQPTANFQVIAQESPKAAAQVQAELAAAQALYPVYQAVAATVAAPVAPAAPTGPQGGQEQNTSPPGGSLDQQQQTGPTVNFSANVSDSGTVTVTKVSVDTPPPVQPPPVVQPPPQIITPPTPPTPPVTGDAPPAIAGDLALTFNQAGSVVLTTVDLRAVDSGSAASQLTFTASAAGQVHGHLALANNPATQITAFSEAQLEAGQVIFVHDGPSNSSASFTVTVSDSGGKTSAPATVNASVRQAEPNLWGELKFPSVVEGRHVFTPSVQLNSLGGFVAISFATITNYDPVNDASGPYTRDQYGAPTDPFFLPDHQAPQLLQSNTVTLPARYFLITSNVGGTTPEGLAAYVTQSNGDGTGADVIQRVKISGASNGALTTTSLGTVISHTGDTIFTLTESYRTSDNTPSGTLQNYDIAWDQYESTAHTYQVYFQTFNPDDSVLDTAPTLTSINLGNVANTNALPAWQFKSGGGAYVLAVAQTETESESLSLNISATSPHNVIHFQGYNTDGTTNSVSFTIEPDLAAYATDGSATNQIVQQVIPSLGQSPGQTLQQVQFVQVSSNNGNTYAIAWNEIVTDSAGTHDQVEFTAFKPGTGEIGTRSTFQFAGGAVQNVHLGTFIDPANSSEDDVVLAYGDNAGTHIVEYQFSTSGGTTTFNQIASIFYPSTQAYANMSVLGDGRVELTYDDLLASDQTSQLDFKIFDLRTAGVTFDGQSVTTHHDNYIAGTAFNDTVTGQSSQNNAYYFVGSSGATPPSDHFNGGSNSGWNTAIFPDAHGNYTITNSNTVITNVGDPAHKGFLTIDSHVEALAFAPTEDPTPGNNGGIVHASGDELLILSNNGTDNQTFAIDGTATLQFVGSVNNNSSVAFDGPGGTLKLDQSTSFNATVSGFGADFIDVRDFDTSASHTVTDTNHVTTIHLSEGTKSASIALSGDYQSAQLNFNSDGHGGLLIGTDHAPVASFINVAVDASVLSSDSVTIPGALLLHDSTDPDAGDQLSLASVDGSQTLGQVQVNQSGDVVYTTPDGFVAPGPEQTVSDQFSYTIADLEGLTSAAHVSLSAQGGAQIVGTADHDLIMGVAGDTLTGMGGGDVFVFQANMGRQIISDFHQGADQVDVSAFGFSAAQLQNIINATTPGDHTLTLVANDTITFQGVDVHQLSASNDFIMSHAGTHGA